MKRGVYTCTHQGNYDCLVGLSRIEGFSEEQVPQGPQGGGPECEGMELGGGKVQGVTVWFLRGQQAGV